MTSYVVPGEQYQYALQNFRIAHEKVESQRAQLAEQERQVALLRQRIARLEGTDSLDMPHSGPGQASSSVDDFSIKNAASALERQINRWAADIVRTPPASLDRVRDAILSDIVGQSEAVFDPATPLIVQNLLRHAMSEAISEGVINCLLVTNSPEANSHLTRIHEHIFSRDPIVASVWRRQTFSAAVDACAPDLSQSILSEHIPGLSSILSPDETDPDPACLSILDSAHRFSRMLHSSRSTSGGSIDAFYRAFVPELGSVLYPRQIELVKRCLKSERGELDRVGATVFPGLVKVNRGPAGSEGDGETVQTVVRRAQCVCECALASGTPVALASNGDQSPL